MTKPFRATVASTEATRRALTHHGIEWSHIADEPTADFIIETSIGTLQVTPTEAYYFCLGLSTKGPRIRNHLIARGA